MKTIPVDKVCKFCKEKKLLVHFGVNDKARDKRDRICKECRTSTSSSELCQCQDSLQWSFRNLEVLDCSEHVSTSCFLPSCISSNTVRSSGHHHEPLIYSFFCTPKNETRKATGNVEYLRSWKRSTASTTGQRESG